MKKIVVLWAMLIYSLHAGSFSAGNKALGITVGSGSVSYAFKGPENYFIAGVSGDYFLTDGLALGLGYRGWFGASPLIHQVTVPLTYYIPTNSRFRPYIGALYRYTYIAESMYDNYSSVGGRAGLAITYTNGYVGFGWVQEYRLDTNSFQNETSGYPEVVVGFSF